MVAAGDGIKHKQPSVTVGAVRELDALLGLTAFVAIDMLGGAERPALRTFGCLTQGLM